MSSEFTKIIIIVFLLSITPLFGSFLYLTLAPSSAQAAPNTSSPTWSLPDLQISIPGLIKFTKPTACPDDPTKTCIPWIGEYIAAIYKYSIGIIGILAATILMWGGFGWLMAGGNAANIGESKAWIGAALTGLILAVSSYLILYRINPKLIQLAPLRVTTVTETKSGVSSPGSNGLFAGICSPANAYAAEIEDYYNAGNTYANDAKITAQTAEANEEISGLASTDKTNEAIEAAARENEKISGLKAEIATLKNRVGELSGQGKTYEQRIDELNIIIEGKEKLVGEKNEIILGLIEESKKGAAELAVATAENEQTILSYQATIDDLSSEILNAENANEILNSANVIYEEQLEKANTAAEDAKKREQALADKLKKMLDRLEAAKQEITELKNTIVDEKTNSESLEELITKLKEKQAEAQGDLEKMQTGLENTRKENENLVLVMGNLEKQKNKIELSEQSTNNQLNSLLVIYEREKKEWEKNKMSLEDQNKTNEQKAQEADARAREADARAREADARAREAQAKANAAEQNIDNNKKICNQTAQAQGCTKDGTNCSLGEGKEGVCECAMDICFCREKQTSKRDEVCGKYLGYDNSVMGCCKVYSDNNHCAVLKNIAVWNCCDYSFDLNAARFSWQPDDGNSDCACAGGETLCVYEGQYLVINGEPCRCTEINSQLQCVVYNVTGAGCCQLASTCSITTQNGCSGVWKGENTNCNQSSGVCF